MQADTAMSQLHPCWPTFVTYYHYHFADHSGSKNCLALGPGKLLHQLLDEEPRARLSYAIYLSEPSITSFCPSILATAADQHCARL